MSQRAYKAIFFDLDGTLLPMDMHDFLRRYFEELQAFAVDAGHDVEKMLAAAGQGTRYVTQATEDGRTNADYFWEYAEAHAIPRAEYEPYFARFYDTNFRNLGEGVVPNPAAAQAIRTCREKGYPLFLTTMPLFPRPAVERRVEWAGLDPAAFCRITTYDNSTATKPSLAYYQENITLAGVDAADILMVGNNTLEDLVAMELGCDGYLVTDWLLNPNEFDVESVKHGTLAEFAQFVEALPECADPAPIACDGPNAKAGC